MVDFSQTPHPLRIVKMLSTFSHWRRLSLKGVLCRFCGRRGTPRGVIIGLIGDLLFSVGEGLGPPVFYICFLRANTVRPYGIVGYLL